MTTSINNIKLMKTLLMNNRNKKQIVYIYIVKARIQNTLLKINVFLSFYLYYSLNKK